MKQLAVAPSSLPPAGEGGHTVGLGSIALVVWRVVVSMWRRRLQTTLCSGCCSWLLMPLRPSLRGACLFYCLGARKETTPSARELRPFLRRREGQNTVGAVCGGMQPSVLAAACDGWAAASRTRQPG
jgi:hypothetical protein